MMLSPCYGQYPGYPGYPGFPGGGHCGGGSGGYPGFPGGGHYGGYPGYPGYPSFPGGGYPCYPSYPGYPGGSYPGFPGFPGGGYPGFPGWGGGCKCGGGSGNVNAPSCPYNPLGDCSAVYGGMYRSDGSTYTFAAATQNYLLQMDSPLPLQHVGFTPSTLTIQCAGTYELTFFGNFAYSVAANLSFYVKANGKKLAETQVDLSTTANKTDSFERTVIVYLQANTSLQAFMDTSAAGTLTFPDNGLQLEVRRISD
ncbi:MAG: hypothetical protein LBJ11_04585 [Oscillospiraceae bacterium]|nr:hypothetical protein [Oscillospiraceae bacterium]